MRNVGKLLTATAQGCPLARPYIKWLNQWIAHPMRNNSTVRRTTFKASLGLNLKSNLRKEKYMATPMQNMKKGKTKSVGVNPIHSAWSSGA